MTTDPHATVDDDAAARHAVEHDLDHALFLEAGAGSGKTSCLVARFVALVESGVPADHIAAVTFTEKAAGELVDRIRTELEGRARSQCSERCAAALDVLDRAAIGTLHAFAQRILNEHPIEAGLPPRIEVLDEIASQVGFEARWEGYVDEIIADPAMARPLRLLLASGAKLEHLHDVAVAFDDNWDLVADRIDWAPPSIPAVAVDELLGEVDAVVALGEHCTNGDDKLLAHLTGRVQQFASRVRDAGDEDARLELLASAKLASGVGQKPNWTSIGVEKVRARLTDLASDCERLRREVQEAVLQVLAQAVARFTVENAQVRRRAGELEFHDLLVLARSVLRDRVHGPGVRAALAQRYERLLLDEFQDTDPIQVELAVLIASDDPRAGEKRWWEVETRPGQLFFVGDPKQSIYRFRRADIAVFLKARDALVGESRPLTRNFRTRRPIVEWVNQTFARLIREEPESQPAYLPLTATRERADSGPPLTFIGREHDKGINADGMRQAEAGDVAAVVCRAMTEKWSVGHRDRDRVERGRAPRWSDIAILLPARTSLAVLERELEAADVPYRAETSSLVYGTRAVRDLLQVARAVEDPADSLAVVAALRTPALACGDDDLFTWRRTHRGGWDHQRPHPDGAPDGHPVGEGLAWLGALHRERLWLAPSAVLERIIRERRLLELGLAERRPRDLWRRLRFVLDQCRAWEEAGGTTLRDYLRWVEGQSAEGSRVVETVLPESDDDAVRILTVHGAKGLEFPIVVLSGMTTEMRRAARGVQVRFPTGADGWAVKLAKGVSTAEFELNEPIDEQMDHHERLRLLYVAATRARDHLVVSVHRKAGADKRGSRTSAEVVWDAGWDPDQVDLWTLETDGGDRPPRAPRGPASAPEVLVADLPSLDEWRAAHDAALATARRPVAVSATRLAEEAAALAAAADAGLAKGPRDLDLPPWQKGRYGTAIGRAVHGVLQTVDLVTGAGLPEACAAQAAAEGVLGKEAIVEVLARSALDADLVRRAARRPYWREVYVGVPYDDGRGAREAPATSALGAGVERERAVTQRAATQSEAISTVLEGYVDLLFRDDDGGLVVVDYKTDAWGSDADLTAKVERYRVQLQAYATAVSTAVGEPVRRAVLLFLGERGAVERDVQLAPA